jgi:hypothetical protein
MNPKQFLTVGGAVLLLLGIIGYLGVFGEGSFLWLTTGENVAHVFLGIVALAAVYVPGLNKALEPFYKPIVILVGVIAVFFGVYGFAVANVPPLNTFGVAHLNNPADNILHLAVGAWALYAALRRQPMMMEKKAM